MRVTIGFVLTCLLGLAGSGGLALADAPNDDAIRRLLAVGPEGRGAIAARRAADELTTAGPQALPAILAAMPADDVVKANWLRSAFGRVVDQALRDGMPLPADDLAAFAADSNKVGRARRLALETLERISPGATARFLADRLADPEFGTDAVATRMDEAAAMEKIDPRKSVGLYNEAFEAAKDFQQCLTLAQRLKALGATVDPLSKLGVIRDWLVIGPFDDPDETAHGTAFPPERFFDPSARYRGKGGEVGWKPFRSDAVDGRVNLLLAVGPHDGAVAYAVAVSRSDSDRAVELRGAGDDNLAVWVNGEKVIDHPTYRSHLRIDWHQGKARLRAGENVILVKVCQCPAPKVQAPGPPAKWEFLLRVVDAEGRGVPLAVVTPTPSPTPEAAR